MTDLEERACAILGLKHASVRCHTAKQWHWDETVSPPTLLLPRDLCEHETTRPVLVVIPSAKRVLVFNTGALSKGTDGLKLKKVKAARDPALGTKLHKMILVTLAPDRRQEALKHFTYERPLEVAWPRLFVDPPSVTPVESDLTLDAFRTLAARGLHEAAEWHLWHLCGRDADKAARLLQTYGDNERARAFVATLVLPYSRLMRPVATSAKLNTTRLSEHQGIVRATTSWEDLGQAVGLVPWLEALSYRAEALCLVRAEYVGAAYLASELKRAMCAALRAHSARFAQRLPESSLQWTHALLAYENKEETTLTEVKELWAKAHYNMASDVSRWATICVPYPSESEAARHAWAALDGLPGAWDAFIKLLTAIGTGDKISHWRLVVAWGSFAAETLRPWCCDPALVPPSLEMRAQWLETRRALRLEEDQISRARAARRAQRLAKGEFMPPESTQERYERLAELAPYERRALKRLFDPETNTNLPPCMQSLFTHTRTEHQIAHEDRLTLSRWLVDLFPADAILSDEQLGTMADFVLGLSSDDSTPMSPQTTERRRAFLQMLRSQARQRNPSIPKELQRDARQCHAIVKLTRTATDPRYACRCPFADSAVPTEQQERLDVKACEAQCCGSSKPFLSAPMDHVLWAHEGGHCVSLSSLVNDW